MQKRSPRPLTARDFRELPEGPPYYQLIEGDLYMSPSPNRFHKDILQNVLVILRNYLERHPLGSVHIAPSDVELSDLNAYEPDLYYVSNERKSILTAQGATGAPDLVVEIFSPGAAKLDKGVKKHVYARAGVKELRLVDPEAREVAVYHLDEDAGTPVATCGAKQKIVSPFFPALEISVEKIFKAWN